MEQTQLILVVLRIQVPVQEYVTVYENLEADPVTIQRMPGQAAGDGGTSIPVLTASRTIETRLLFSLNSSGL